MVNNRLIIDKIKEDLDDIWSGSPWYGKSVRELLTNITYSSPPMVDIMRHMIAWRVFVLKKIQGIDYKIEMDSAVDWPEGSSMSWEESIDWLEQNIKDIKSEISKKTDIWLETQVIGENYDHRFLLNGISQHDIYHIGQITLMNKLGI